MFRAIPPFVAALFIVCIMPCAALADHATSVSGRMVVDALAPEIAIQAPTGDEVLYGGEVFGFSWTVVETHPSHSDNDRKATVKVGGGAPVTSLFSSTTDQFHWDWTVPNISSGSNVLEIAVRDAFGNESEAVSAPFTILLHGTSVPGGIPAVSHLGGPRPNPFNPRTAFVFGLAAPGRAVLTVHDVRGRAVRTLVDQRMPAGTWSFDWDGRDDTGRPLPGGAYLARLSLGGATVGTRKAVLLP